MIHIANKTYELVAEHKDGWKPDAFKERYSEVLERYDYIVGDWGYNQLRLRGFFKDNNPKASKEASISTLQDYLNEYCNFGCAYFIIEKIATRGHQPVLNEDGLFDPEAQFDVTETIQTLEQPQQFERHQYQPPQKNQQERQQPRPQNQGQRPPRKPHHNNQNQRHQKQQQPQQQQQAKQQGSN